MANTNWTFLHANDSHMGTPRSYRFRPAINRRWAAIVEQMAAIDADLLLHGGDLTRDGDSHEFEYQQARDDLDTLPFPAFVIPGNMDVGNKCAEPREKGRETGPTPQPVTAQRLDLFASYFGPIHWSFLYRDVRFTGIFAAVAGSGLPHEQRLWHLLEKLPKLPRARHHVAVMHYWPFMETPDEPAWDSAVEEEYYDWYFSISPPHRQRLLELLQASGVEILFCGHVHTGRPVQRVEGIRSLPHTGCRQHRPAHRALERRGNPLRLPPLPGQPHMHRSRIRPRPGSVRGIRRLWPHGPSAHGRARLLCGPGKAAAEAFVVPKGTGEPPCRIQ